MKKSYLILVMIRDIFIHNNLRPNNSMKCTNWCGVSASNRVPYNASGVDMCAPVLTVPIS